jgi:hypothetical protein
MYDESLAVQPADFQDEETHHCIFLEIVRRAFEAILGKDLAEAQGTALEQEFGILWRIRKKMLVISMDFAKKETFLPVAATTFQWSRRSQKHPVFGECTIRKPQNRI